MYDRIDHLYACQPKPGTLRLEWRPTGAATETTLSELGLPDDLRNLDSEPDAARLEGLVNRVLPEDQTFVRLWIDGGSSWFAALPWEAAIPGTVLRMSRFSLLPALQNWDHVATLVSDDLNSQSVMDLIDVTPHPKHRTYLEPDPLDGAINWEWGETPQLDGTLLQHALDRLRDPADIVEVLAPLVLAGDEPALMLRMGDREQLVTATELSLFAAHAGAWLVVLYTLDETTMRLARVLAQRLTESGPVVCRVEALQPLGKRSRTFYASPLAETPHNEAARLRGERLLNEYSFAEYYSSPMESPRWVQPAQRILERYLAEYFEHIAGERRPESAAWKGMLQGIADARDAFAEGR